MTKGSLPDDLSSWYPLVRGPFRCEGALRMEDGASPSDWERLSSGGSLLLTAGLDASFAPRGPSLRRPNLAALRASIPAELRVERFQAFANTGGGYVLLNADDPACYRTGLTLLPGGRRRWRAVKRALSLGSRLGWSRAPGAGEVLLISRPPLPLGRLHSTALRGRLCGVAAGVPGVDRKLTVLLAETAGLPARFVKLARTEAGKRQVEREVDALARLKSSCPGLHVAPRLLDQGDAEGTGFLVQEALPGRRAPDRITPLHVEFLREVCRRTLRRAPLHELGRFDRDRDMALRLGREGDPWGRAMHALASALVEFFGARPIPCSLAHGDFTPWNLRAARGELRAFDWEYSQRSAPALHDLFHFVAQSGILVRRHGAERILTETRTLLAGLARPLCADALLDERDRLGAFGLYLLNQSVCDEARNTLERPPFAQVDWLRETRTELARRLTHELRSATTRSGQERAA